MKYYYKIEHNNNLIYESRNIPIRNDKNAIEINEAEYNAFILEFEKQQLEEAYKDYVANGGTLSKEEWLTQQTKR